MKIEDLREYENNPRFNGGAVGAVCPGQLLHSVLFQPVIGGSGLLSRFSFPFLLTLLWW